MAGNPWLTGMPWAPTGGVYPTSGNPWSAQLTTPAAPAYSFFTPAPAGAPSALDFNWLFNQRDKAILYNAAAVGAYCTIARALMTFDGTPQQILITGWGGAFNLANGGAFSTYTVGTAGYSTLAALTTQVGDILVVDYRSGMMLGDNSGTPPLHFAGALRLEDSQNGGTHAPIPGAQVPMEAHDATVGGSPSFTFAAPCAISGERVITTAGTYALFINGESSATGDVYTVGSFVLRVTQLRANP
jgi:hypothetical protein